MNNHPLSWRDDHDGGRMIDRLALPQHGLVRALLDHGTVGIVILDGAGRVVRANDALRSLLAASCDLTQGADGLAIFCPHSRGEALEAVSPVALGLRPGRRFISMVPGNDDTEHAVDVSVVPLHEADGTVSGALLQVHDVSVQMRLQAELSHGQKLQAIGQFTSGIAHDFNNLLMAITSAADEMLTRGGLDAADEADLQQILSSGERGASLVRALLAFSKQQPLQMKMVVVDDAVTALSGLLNRLLGGAVKLRLALQAPYLQALVDPAPLDQVLVNLVINARNAMPDGGTVTIKTQHVDIDAGRGWDGAAIPAGSYLGIDVQDTGTGIPPELLPRIFEPFFTTRGDQGGSGLGLATVDAIVRRFQGFLTIDSQVGQGTRVSIYVPCHGATGLTVRAQPAAPEPQSAAPGIRQQPASDRAVLLIDDEAGVCALVARALTARGWRVLCAESGEAALALLQAESDAAASLSAIITDVTLPGMDGSAVVRAVRQLRPGLPAVLTSGYSIDAVQAIHGREDVLFISKPYSLKALFAALEGCAFPSHHPGPSLTP